MQRQYPSYFIYRDIAGLWRWRYDASNGRTIAVSSESYFNRSDCERGIDIMKASFTVPVWIPNVDANVA
ncbi:YegP family protein [Sphingobium mellinum]|uniref:YegP family protein n=1 Tax=Sphingobium mellinum TaxID=1387166 RepID=UPI003BF60BD6